MVHNFDKKYKVWLACAILKKFEQKNSKKEESTLSKVEPRNFFPFLFLLKNKRRVG